jgi:peptidyl-dipeptidase Dcp
MTSENPLLSPFVGRYGEVPFQDIKREHYLPAVDQALQLAKSRVDAIKNSTEPPTFKNTCEAMETCSDELDTSAGIYFNLYSAEADDQLQALAQEISPKLAAFSNDIHLDLGLFKRVKALWEKRDSLKLNKEQKMLLDKQYKGFVRNGALLTEEQKQELRKIDEELSVLGPQFAQNVQKATHAFQMPLTQEDELAGLSDREKDAAKQAAIEKKLPGWLVTLDYPSFMAFIKNADRRDLREKLWKAHMKRAFGDEFDNQKNVRRIAELRAARAKLLGFESHASYVLEERMAEKPEKVWNFLEKIFQASKPAAEKELQELKNLRKSLDGSSEIKAWDFAYYSEKLRQKKYSFDEEALRPYFRLEDCVQGIFKVAGKLYDLAFKEVSGLQTYHPDVKVFEVSEISTGEHIGLFYADFFPRTTKKGGAWMTQFLDQGLQGGVVRRPHVAIVCNFTKPTPTTPSLLSLDEVKTLFHEFGHALHGLLSKCTYRSVAGTNVYWDFVELPSQIMENWLEEKETLDLFAAHYQTGEKIPLEMIQKIRDVSKFQAGFNSMRQVSFGILDMCWHDRASLDPNLDVKSFEEEALRKTRLLEYVENTNFSCSFGHIFAGGYSAGYYSYKWAEVLDADAFEYFKEKGIYNSEVAKSFKENILSRGGTEHPMELYKKFRGREPDPEALLRRDGLIA